MNQIKKYFSILITGAFFLMGGTVNAQSSSIYDQLVAVNSEWKNQQDVDPALKTKPALPLNERELVRMHLLETEKLLRSRSTSQLSVSQKASRESSLDVLHAYMLKGSFPLNNRYQNRQPIFIDDHNTYCAVGYLMKESGADAMAKEIQRTQNYNYLGDIRHDQLMEWAAGSGLDFGELALIQPGYGGEWPCTITEMHYNNTGSDVDEYIEFHESNGGLSGMGFLTSVEFYDHLDVLYKTLVPAQMQTIQYNSNNFFYYLFPANENFADSGKIVLKSTTFGGPARILSILYYNDAGVTLEDHYLSSTNPAILNFSSKEDETTVAGNSLSFCGTYKTDWNASILPATVGTVNTCVICGPVPVKLSSFDYSLHNKTVELKWQTVTESNNKYFDIERSSDGINFTPVGRVQGAGTSNNINNYSFTDRYPGFINHYRLKQVDLDAKFSYSKVLYVKVSNLDPFIVHGNIVQNELTVQVNSELPGAGTIIVYDFSGRAVLKLEAQKGPQHINVSALSCGKYIVRLYTKDMQVYSRQFIKG